MHKQEAKSKRQILLIKHQGFIKVQKKFEEFTQDTSKSVNQSRRVELDEEVDGRWARAALGRHLVGGVGRPLGLLPPLASSFRRDVLPAELNSRGADSNPKLSTYNNLCRTKVGSPLSEPSIYTPKGTLYMETNRSVLRVLEHLKHLFPSIIKPLEESRSSITFLA